jgi:phage baseplate assembly protein gpV
MTMIRIGEVWTVDSAAKTVTVRWPDTGTVSGDLYVIRTGTSWLPNIGDTAVVAFLPVQDGDGIVLGVTQK